MQLHDWHAAVAALLFWEVYNQFGSWRTRIMLTIHNMDNTGAWARGRVWGGVWGVRVLGLCGRACVTTRWVVEGAVARGSGGRSKLSRSCVAGRRATLRAPPRTLAGLDVLCAALRCRRTRRHPIGIYR